MSEPGQAREMSAPFMVLLLIWFNKLSARGSYRGLQKHIFLGFGGAHLTLVLLLYLLDRGFLGLVWKFVKGGVHPSILPESLLVKSEVPR